MAKLPSYMKIAKIEGDLKGAAVTWNWDWSEDSGSPNVTPMGQYCIVTNQEIEDKPAVLPNPGTLTLTPSVICGESTVTLAPITLKIEVEFVEPTPPCCPKCPGLANIVLLTSYYGGGYIFSGENCDPCFTNVTAYEYGMPAVLAARKPNGEFIPPSSVSVTGVRQIGTLWSWNISDTYVESNNSISAPELPESVGSFIQFAPEYLWGEGGYLEVDVIVSVDGGQVQATARIAFNIWN